MCGKPGSASTLHYPHLKPALQVLDEGGGVDLGPALGQDNVHALKGSLAELQAIVDLSEFVEKV